MTLVERFLKYVSFDTQSSEETGDTPSTPGQMVFARYLKEELETLGLEEITLDENGYLFATLPANTDKPMPAVNDKFIQFRLSFFLCAQLSIAATASERNRNRPDTATHGECQNRHACRPFPFLYSAPVPCAGRLLFSGGKKAASFFRLSRIIFSGLHTI